MIEHREEFDEKVRQKREDNVSDIDVLISGGKIEELKDFLNQMEPEDVAEILNDFSVKDKLIIFNLLNNDSAAVVLDDTDPQSRLQILQKIESTKLARVLDEMPVDEAVDLIEEIPHQEREGILDLLGKEDAEEVEEILKYPEDSAGRLMNTEFFFVREGSDVEATINNIRSIKIDDEVYYIYVVDENMKLRGIIPIRKLITCPAGTLISSIMDDDVHAINVHEDQEKVAQVMKKYDLSSLPVIDDNDKLIGRITVDDVMDVMDEEHGEDISRMAGTIEEEFGTETTVQATQNRLPWLVTCMIGSIITGLVIQFFEVTIAETIALVSFIPVITATGGNSGVQASTVVVREIALGRMVFSHVGEEIWRQLKIAMTLGGVCGTILSFLAIFWKKNSMVGLIVGLSIFLVVVWSNFVGVLIPVVFRKLKIDPALASGPLITTLNDVIGVFIYLSVATSFLS